MKTLICLLVFCGFAVAGETIEDIVKKNIAAAAGAPEIGKYKEVRHPDGTIETYYRLGGGKPDMVIREEPARFENDNELIKSVPCEVAGNTPRPAIKAGLRTAACECGPGCDCDGCKCGCKPGYKCDSNGCTPIRTRKELTKTECSCGDSCACPPGECKCDGSGCSCPACFAGTKYAGDTEIPVITPDGKRYRNKAEYEATLKPKTMIVAQPVKRTLVGAGFQVQVGRRLFNISAGMASEDAALSINQLLAQEGGTVVFYNNGAQVQAPVWYTPVVTYQQMPTVTYQQMPRYYSAPPTYYGAPASGGGGFRAGFGFSGPFGGGFNAGACVGGK
jgi:hypothetical protein